MDLTKLAETVSIDTDALTLTCVVAAIQLASRHPGYTGPSSKIVKNFARTVQAQLKLIAPENDIILEMGWNPDYDVPAFD